MEREDSLTAVSLGQKQAEMYLFQGNLHEAFLTIQAVLKIADPSAETYKILGNIQQRQGLLTEAIASYLKAIELDPNFALPYANLGSIYALQNQWKEAIDYYQQAIQLAPNIVGIYRNLGKIWQHLGNDAEFYKCRYYTLLYQSEPVNYYDYVQLGHQLLKIGEKEKAIDCYQRCLAIHPQHFIVLTILGDLSAEAGELDKAQHYYEQSLVNHDNPAKIYNKIGDIYLKQENLDQALFYYIESLKCKTDFLESYGKIRSIIEKKGKFVNFYSKDGFDFPSEAIADLLALPKDKLIQSTPELQQIDIYAGEKIKLQASITIGEVRKLFSAQLLNVPNTYISILPQGKIWGDNMNALVMNERSQILTNISIGFSALISFIKLPEVKYLPGKVTFLTVRWGAGYFHWMFDLVARIKLLLEANFTLEEIDYFVINHYENPYRQETLAKLNIPLEKVVATEDHHYIQGENLIIPSHPYLTGSNISPWACQFLKDTFLPAGMINSPYGERIYISRSQASRRRIINEAEILEDLNKLGFVSICLESMSVEAQALCMAGAKVIIAAHGAGLTNIVFCQAGTKIIELFSDQYLVGLYWKISNVCGLQHYYLINQSIDVPGYDKGNSLDIWVDRQKFLKLLELAEVA
jgi:tetratricopeptide (TPR) repeat protein